VLAVVDTWAALTRSRPHRPALSGREALAVLRQQAGLGRLPVKLVDALEPLVISARPGSPPVNGQLREPSPGGRDQGDEPEEPEGRSSRNERRLTVVTRQVAGGLALSL
jgi:hypothetical protein